MDKPIEFTAEFINNLYAGEGYSDTIRVTFGLFDIYKTEFIVGKSIYTKAPHWLRCMSEETMQGCTTLELVGAPKHLKGEWKQVFDEEKNVIVKYFPTPEEEEQQQHTKKMAEKNNDIDWFL